jgi:hypothetical protein
LISTSSDSNNDVSTSLSTSRPPLPTLSLIIKQEVAFLAENINTFNDLDEELSGPGEIFHRPYLRHLRLPSFLRDKVRRLKNKIRLEQVRFNLALRDKRERTRKEIDKIRKKYEEEIKAPRLYSLT